MKARAAIGHTIYARRHDLGMTGLDLARASGVSNAYISEVEHGKKEPSSDYLALLAKGLGLTVGDILTESGRLMNEWEGYLTSVEAKRTVEV
jgi:transcriptional regulator with XRE-family HTH domain